MESSDAKNGSQSVQVAVKIQPQFTYEAVDGWLDCISVTPGEPQVQIGPHSFTFDYVYGSTGSPSSWIFYDCVEPLVDALFHGSNATVLAYGQSGSGKTHTMEGPNGIIHRVMHTIFKRVEEAKGTTEFLIRVHFIEILKEEVFDLLGSTRIVYPKAGGNVKPPCRAPIKIRETANGGISLDGLVEPEVTSLEEMTSFLFRGSECQATGSTQMNSQSSRSHAIFTIKMEQKKRSGIAIGGVHDDAGDGILCAKLHLVDLAGSERTKKTGADGMRFQQGIHINGGLLALANVMSALGDDKKRKEGGHVPYRNSKLTHLLQDSLGGNSKTVMIACVSPADANFNETLSTLKFANRVRNIPNKAIVNREPVTAQMQRMENQIEQFQAELLYVKGDYSTLFEELQIQKQKTSLLETSNTELQNQLREQVNFQCLTKQAIEAQVQSQQKIEQEIEQLRLWKSCLEREVLQLKKEGRNDIEVAGSSSSGKDEWGRDHRRTQNAECSHSENVIQKAPSGVCCSCTVNSTCKTINCECHLLNGYCCMSCKCHPKKCGNRVAVVVQSYRKPLSDIGNKLPR